MGRARAGLALSSGLGAQWDPEGTSPAFSPLLQQGPSLPCSPGPAHSCSKVLPCAVAPGLLLLARHCCPDPLPRPTARSARSCRSPAEATALCKGEVNWRPRSQGLACGRHSVLSTERSLPGTAPCRGEEPLNRGCARSCCPQCPWEWPCLCSSLCFPRSLLPHWGGREQEG